MIDNYVTSSLSITERWTSNIIQRINDPTSNGEENQTNQLEKEYPFQQNHHEGRIE